MDFGVEGMFDSEIEYKDEVLVFGDTTLKLKSVEEHNCHLKSQVSQVSISSSSLSNHRLSMLDSLACSCPSMSISFQ